MDGDFLDEVVLLFLAKGLSSQRLTVQLRIPRLMSTRCPHYIAFGIALEAGAAALIVEMTDCIEVQLLDCGRGSAKIGIEAPLELTLLREEIV